MTSVYLLKPYNGKGIGAIVEVEEEVALDLVAQAVARNTTVRDFLVKPQMGRGKVITRAFRSAPQAR